MSRLKGIHRRDKKVSDTDLKAIKGCLTPDFADLMVPSDGFRNFPQFF